MEEHSNGNQAAQIEIHGAKSSSVRQLPGNEYSSAYGPMQLIVRSGAALQGLIRGGKGMRFFAKVLADWTEPETAFPRINACVDRGVYH
ncbi:hypothetical protein Mal52_13000 [Symmachiella dynata]|uniref:Uncharacterized protein n=1 Tax=Symmachiella dynata TaxID=2527995 RepID=A0A517ZK29_9PLAN|nr:hypothetical protein [Symmachiella dynata]QDU42831.1 hypothetical protein Mal52_13000 [Symmachiella dynata]